MAREGASRRLAWGVRRKCNYQRNRRNTSSRTRDNEGSKQWTSSSPNKPSTTATANLSPCTSAPAPQLTHPLTAVPNSNSAKRNSVNTNKPAPRATPLRKELLKNNNQNVKKKSTSITCTVCWMNSSIWNAPRGCVFRMRFVPHPQREKGGNELNQPYESNELLLYLSFSRLWY